MGSRRPKSKNGNNFLPDCGSWARKWGNSSTAASPKVFSLMWCPFSSGIQTSFSRKMILGLIRPCDTAVSGTQQHNSFPHLARSVNLNPIENVWDAFQRLLNQLQPRPATALQLAVAMGTDPRWTCQCSINSIGRRCRALVVANGRHILYWFSV